MAAVEATGPAWSRLLDPASADRARDAAAVIAAGLLRSPGHLDAAPPTVAGGTLGAALFFAALGEATGERVHLDTAAALLDDAIGKTVAMDRPDVALYGTPVGLGWTAAVLAGRVPGNEPDDDETDVDRFVATLLGVSPWPGPVDLLHGLAGLGTYCLARLPLPSARRDLDRVVAHLADTAVADDDGLAWPFVPPSVERYAFDERRPPGHVDVGFAHGVAGIVTFLAAAVAADVAGARALLEPAVRWLTAHRLAPGDISEFPGFVTAGRPPAGTRLAWCYGDPGIAVALLAAGEALGDADLVAQAAGVAVRCAEREPIAVDSATLCHGSAGLGHMYNRLGQALGDERLLDAARHWFGETLGRWLPALDIADQPRAKEFVEAGGVLAVEPGPGLLLGPAGVGLALLSAATDVEPWWDPVLLVRQPGTWGVTRRS